MVKAEDDFLAMRRQLDSQLPRLEAKLLELDEKIPEISYQWRKGNERVESLEDERSYLLEANSSVPAETARLRDSLAKSLDRDSAELPFVAELVQVMPDEDKWSGPIERLIRSFALTVVLPAKLAAKAEAFLEENHLGERLAFVCPRSEAKEPKLHDDSAVAKLALRPELDAGRQSWLRHALSERFPHICIAERDANFSKIKNALTLEGLVKTGGVLREKDDSLFLLDASQWVCGWDVIQNRKFWTKH